MQTAAGRARQEEANKHKSSEASGSKRSQLRLVKEPDSRHVLSIAKTFSAGKAHFTEELHANF